MSTMVRFTEYQPHQTKEEILQMLPNEKKSKDFKDSNMLKKKNTTLMNWKELIKRALKVVHERKC